MYEQDEPVLRRILLIVLWFIVIVTVLWAIVWLIFFRHSTPKTPSGKAPAQQSQSSGKSKGQSSTGPKSSGSGGSPASTSPSPSSASSGSTTPGSLANTGAGDIFVPFTIATGAGTMFYHVRQRKKMTR